MHGGYLGKRWEDHPKKTCVWLKGKFEPCHINFTKFVICHPDPYVIDSCVSYISLRYRWHISNFTKLGWHGSNKPILFFNHPISPSFLTKGLLDGMVQKKEYPPNIRDDLVREKLADSTIPPSHLRLTRLSSHGNPLSPTSFSTASFFWLS